jgi:imidazolonepropionase-like amidohydrolase
MKVNTKSTITLPREEMRMVLALKAKLKARSNVEVVRRGLLLLRESTEREALREAYRRAARATRESLSHELPELDHLAAEGLADS